MHERYCSIFIRQFVFSILILARASAQAQTADTVKVEPNHSTVAFVVPIAGGITKVTGKFNDFKATLSWNEPITKDSDLTKCSGTDWVHSAIPNFIGDEVAVEIDLWTRPPKKKP